MPVCFSRLAMCLRQDYLVHHIAIPLTIDHSENLTNHKDFNVIVISSTAVYDSFGLLKSVLIILQSPVFASSSCNNFVQNYPKLC